MVCDGVIIINVIYAYGGLNIGIIDIDHDKHTHLSYVSHLVVHKQFEVVSVMGERNA